MSTPAQASFPGKNAQQSGPGYSREEQAPLHLYTLSTPNGQKPQIALEELYAHYGESHKFTWDCIDISGDTQKQPWFTKFNPNGRIPALIDHTQHASVPSGLFLQGEGFPVFESSAILLYLSKKWDRDNIFGFNDPFEDSQMLQWLFFIQGGLGPMQGQLNHFNKHAKEKIPYAINRYYNETKRLYSVMEGHLDGSFTSSEPREYLAGRDKGKYSWADMNAYGWTKGHAYTGISAEEFEKEYPHLKQWLARIGAREAVRKGTEGYSKPT